MPPPWALTANTAAFRTTSFPPPALLGYCSHIIYSYPSEVTPQHDTQRDQQHPKLAAIMTSIASVVTKTVTAASTAASATSSDRATPQGGILEGSNPSKYDPKNPLFLFIIQVRSQSSSMGDEGSTRESRFCGQPFQLYGQHDYCQISCLRS
jgi:hypothetical protein